MRPYGFIILTGSFVSWQINTWKQSYHWRSCQYKLDFILFQRFWGIYFILFNFIFKTVKHSLMENKYHLVFWGSWLGALVRLKWSHTWATCFECIYGRERTFRPCEYGNSCYFISFLIFVLVTRWDVNIFSHILEGFEDKACPFLPLSKGQPVFQTEKLQTVIQMQTHTSLGPLELTSGRGAVAS